MFISDISWFVLFISFVIVFIFYNKLKEQINDLKNDLVTLKKDLQQQKDSLNAFKSLNTHQSLSKQPSKQISEQTFEPTTEPIITPFSQDIPAKYKRATESLKSLSTITPPPLPDNLASNRLIENGDKVAVLNPQIYTFFADSASLSLQPINRKQSLPAQSNHSNQQQSINKTAKSSAVMEPDEQSIPMVTSLFNSAKNWFFGGNLVVRVGVLVLLVGVILLLRLLSEYIETPIEVKLMAIGLAGLALAGLGFKLVKKRFAYGVTLQGTGLAIAYLTTFFAYDVYQVLGSLPSFIGLGVLSAATIGLAVRQNAFPLALLALSGGFFAPLLTSTETGSLTALFSYYLLLNVTIAIIAHYRTWKVLNLLGVVVTFGLAYVLGASESFSNVIAQRWTLVLLVALHFALYLFVVIRYAQQIITYNLHTEARLAASSTSLATSRKPASHLYLFPIDTGLLFSVPVLAFGLFAVLLSDIEHALTVTSALLASVYMVMGWILAKRSPRYALMIEGMLALGFGFFAVTIALALDSKWIAAGWSIQALALVWFGRRSLRAWTVIFGLILQLISVAMLSLTLIFPIESYAMLALIISASACLATAFILRSSHSPMTLSQHSEHSIHSSGVEQYACALGISEQAASQWLAGINSNSSAFKFIWRNPTLINILTFAAGIWALYIIVDCFETGQNWFISWQLAMSTLIATAMLSSLIIYWLIDRYQSWLEIRRFSYAILLPFYILLVAQLPQKFEFNLQWSLLNWTVFSALVIGWALMGQLWLKRWHDNSASSHANNKLSMLDYASWLATGILLLAAAVHYGLPDSNGISDGVMAVLTVSLCLLALVAFAERKFASWLPWFDWYKALVGCSFIFIPFLLGWVMITNTYHEGVVWNLPYIPVFNLYDIAVLLALTYGLSMSALYQNNYVAGKTANAQTMPLADWAKMVLYAIGITGFWVCSSIVVRTLYTYAGTPLWIDGGLFNDKVQISLVIMWSLSAFFVQRQLPRLLPSVDWQRIFIIASYVLVPLMLIWVVATNGYHDGVIWNLPYIPVLNLYDFAVLSAMAYGGNLYYVQQRLIQKNAAHSNAHNTSALMSYLLRALGIIGFWVLSSMLVRTLHAYAGTPLWTQGAWGDDKVQTSLTILWTLTALIATFMSSRNGKRFWWFMGISLLGAVVLKLVLVDLSQTGAIWRVVSFLVAGSMILLIGYLAPLPPDEIKKTDKVNNKK